MMLYFHQNSNDNNFFLTLLYKGGLFKGSTATLLFPLKKNKKFQPSKMMQNEWEEERQEDEEGVVHGKSSNCNPWATEKKGNLSVSVKVFDEDDDNNNNDGDEEEELNFGFSDNNDAEQQQRR